MQCAQAEVWITQRVFTVLTPEQEQELQEHLAQCSECQALAGKYSRAVAALEEKPKTDPDPYLASRVVHRAREQTALGMKKSTSQWWLSAAASVAVLALVVVVTPRWINSPAMSTQETIDAYTEDIKALGFWEEDENGNGDTFDYENYGVPTEVVKHLI